MEIQVPAYSITAPPRGANLGFAAGLKTVLFLYRSSKSLDEISILVMVTFGKESDEQRRNYIDFA
jgi:hypothetical protein